MTRIAAILSCALAIVVLGAAPGARAAALTMRGGPLSMVAHEQPLPTFLSALLAREGLRTVVSPQVKGAVSGEFHGPAMQTLEQVLTAFNLFAYFDGETVYIQPVSAVQTRDVPLEGRSGAVVLDQVQRRGLTDRRDRVSLRDGRLVASGAEAFVRQVADLVRQMPGGTTETEVRTASVPATPEYRVYYLRYAWATDQKFRSGGQILTIPGLASVLRPLIARSAEHAAAAQPDRTVMSSTQPRLGGSGRIAQSASPPSPLSVASLADSIEAARGAPAPSLPISPSAAPDSDGPRLEADARLNAIIIRDMPDRLDAYGALIKALDVEPQIIEIEAKIIDIDIERAKQHGFSLDFQDRSGQTLGLLEPGLTNPAPGQGGFVSTVIHAGGSLTINLKALESQGDAQITSRPLVMTLSDVEAVFGDSQTFFVRVAGSLSADLFNVTAGTTLRVTPHALRDGGPPRIRMLVSIEDGKLGNTNVDNIPVVDNAELNTQALIQEGQSLLVGGMVVHGSKTNVDKVPVLGDLPLLKPLFRSSDKSSSHIERLFLITPRLVAPGQPIPIPTEEAAESQTASAAKAGAQP